LNDRVAIVTGGALGIGGATARRLAEEGARVLIADVNIEVADQNASTIRAAGGTAEALRTDVSVHGDVRAMVAHAVDRWGRLFQEDLGVALGRYAQEHPDTRFPF